MRFLSKLTDHNLGNRIALLRVDFNIDFSAIRLGQDLLRLEAVLPTIKFLLERGAKVIILSHRGRPAPKRSEASKRVEFSLISFVSILEKKLKQKVGFTSNLSTSQVHRLLRNCRIVLLENLRFWPEEEKNGLNFAKKLAKLGDFYVNDAFAVCHRKNASVVQLPRLLPSYAGLLLEKEIKMLSTLIKSPPRPFVLIFGGAKIKDKLPAIKNLLSKADALLLGSSVLQTKERLPYSKKIHKPADWIMKDGKILDIGALTVDDYRVWIKNAKMILWNGPLGKTEDSRFAKGSIEIAKALIQGKAFSIIGGGETTALFLSVISNYQSLISKNKLFLSTGGGAMLEFLSGKKLPGIEALK
ncbi:MAG: hypothetical protein A3A16_01215 [Candidatus Harrisonbacteria bacterium RIFCSPLOWO2_01_FULL_44_18]|uniref:Phosphoglycerate kinase n=1 Tax=Candidatus Harrisonbacteria bacterium RIFCSPLOWO2_01_FULL_44_18 TaxID=1798407 RepID=A0A1G1ZQG1_9BACT|nr:MAG: hypothetical protein A3A16_01215 [Candidatus Harrisonbacteria bacterium RIFCSPLOWO2_01_FULL_44_18]